jgi:1,4-dihydroxy-6-naphthoate synthase
MTRRLRLGISTCPNDTFAFHALLTGEVEAEGLAFDVELLDVQELNEAMLAGRFDVAKVSFRAALELAEEAVVLESGAALGFGVGPLLLAAPGRTRPDAPSARPPLVLCPGRFTTATLLWTLFHPEPVRLEQRLFSEIMPALARGEADFGVCIHEGRFTWRDSGLALVEDLGAVWEGETGEALPLGGIVARRALGPDVLARAGALVRRSLAWGLAHRERCLPTMRRYAVEQTDAVLWAHVDLYVIEWTLSLGDVGRRALAALSRRAAARGLIGAHGPLEIA